jgi:hypothetical protein
MSNLTTLLGIGGSLCLAAPSLAFLRRRREYDRFLATYRAMTPAARERDPLWSPAKDTMLMSLIDWSRIDAWALLAGAAMLFLSFLLELFKM